MASFGPNRAVRSHFAVVWPVEGGKSPRPRPSGRDHPDDDLLEPCAGCRLDHARGVELGEGLVPVAAGLIAGVVACADPLEDMDDLGQLGRARLRLRVQLQQPTTVLGAGLL